MKTVATLVQHPVGQGGMMSGRLKVPGGVYRWIYDCGSDQRTSLDREIAVVSSQGPVDCLFISHLDNDHVEGVDRLLFTTTVGEVVIPYLDNVDKIVAAAHAMTTSSATGNYLALLSDVEGWFRQRGVERLIVIGSGDDGAEPSVPEPPLAPVGDGAREGPLVGKWFSPYQSITDKSSITTRYLNGASQAVSSRNAFSTGSSRRIRIAHRLSKRGYSKRRCMQSSGCLTTHPSSFLVCWKIVLEGKKLRSCYEEIWSNHNLVSMSLYAGPLTKSASQRFEVRSPYSFSRLDAAGWLLTGDMHLNVNRRREKFFSFYEWLAPNVGVFSLPHHGSDLNFDASVISKFPNAYQYIAAYGRNSYGIIGTDHETDDKWKWAAFCFSDRKPPHGIALGIFTVRMLAILGCVQSASRTTPLEFSRACLPKNFMRTVSIFRHRSGSATAKNEPRTTRGGLNQKRV